MEERKKKKHDKERKKRKKEGRKEGRKKGKNKGRRIKEVQARQEIESGGILPFHSWTFCIFQLSSCPHLKLFATSSEDQSIKLWNIKNQLVRELNFDDTLCGVCFANHRGDLLVGFQCHISLVTLTNYLPGTYLDRVSSMHFENDPVERYVQFDDHLQFWYDPKIVPKLPMDLSQRRPLLPPMETPQPWEEVRLM